MLCSFLWLHNIPLPDGPHFMYPFFPADQHVGCFHFLTVVKCCSEHSWTCFYVDICFHSLGQMLGAELLGYMVTLWVRQWGFMSFINMHRVLGLYLLNMWGCVLFAVFSELTAPLPHVRRGNLGTEASFFEHRRGWEGGGPLGAMSPWTNPLKQPPLPVCMQCCSA